MLAQRIERWQMKRRLGEGLRFMAAFRKAGHDFSSLTDEELTDHMRALREDASAGELSGDRLDIEVLHLIREAAQRSLKMRPYDSQVLGAWVLSRGKIAEMATGEGKTLVAPMASALRWVRGEQVHIFTANEYLAQRDANLMFPLYALLGMNVSVVVQGQSSAVRKQVYAFDVVYGTPNEVVQDFLNDQLVAAPEELKLPLALGTLFVDEVDQVLIDEARTPIIITSPMATDRSYFERIQKITAMMTQGDSSADEDAHYWVDPVANSSFLTEKGYELATEQFRELGLLPPDAVDYGGEHSNLVLSVIVSLGAVKMLRKGVNYVVQDDRIVVIDQNTGRLMPGRGWDSGMQQAIEVKEGLKNLTPEHRTLGRITLQNYVKRYKLLGGMTGTAIADAEEFGIAYQLDVLAIEPNTPCIREDLPDRFFRSQAAKLDAVVAEVQERHSKGQPILVGTASVEQSQELSDRLKQAEVPHTVLNAENHSQEAFLLAGAGNTGAVTITTNMAGRGVDIKLGRDPSEEWHAMRLGKPLWEDLWRNVVNHAGPLARAAGVEFPEKWTNDIELSITHPDVGMVVPKLKELGIHCEVVGREEPTLKLYPTPAPAISDALLTMGQAKWDALPEEKQTTAIADFENARKEREAHVRSLGGLHVIGLERYESLRLDRQLRGRAGRQGDPGSSCFYISMEDPLIENNTGEYLQNLFITLDIKPGDELEQKFVRKAVDMAQRQTEGRNLSARAEAAKFDSELDGQRQVIHSLHAKFMGSDTDVKDWAGALISDQASEVIEFAIPHGTILEEWNTDGLDAFLVESGILPAMDGGKRRGMLQLFKDSELLSPDATMAQLEDFDCDDAQDGFRKLVLNRWTDNLNATEPEIQARLVRFILVRALADAWADQVDEMVMMRRGINLQVLAQKNPEREFKRKAFELFESRLAALYRRMAEALLRVQVTPGMLEKKA